MGQIYSLILRGPHGEPENIVEFLESVVQVMQLFHLWDIFIISIAVSLIFGMIMFFVRRLAG